MFPNKLLFPSLHTVSIHTTSKGLKRVSCSLYFASYEYINFFFVEEDGEKEDRGPNGDVGIEENSGSDGKGEWTEMVQACVEVG